MLKPQTKKSFTTYIMVIVAFVIMMILSSTGNVSSQIDGLLVPLCVYSILAVSLNLTVGILGELSLGQAGFMCVGAYASALFSIATKETILVEWVRFPLAILVGGIFAAIFGILIGIPVLRLNGDYLAIVTLAFGEIIKNVVNIINFGVDSNGWHFSTKSTMELGLEADGNVIIKGAQGASGVSTYSTFVAGFVLIMIALVVVLNLVRSRTGRAIEAVRDNRIAAESVGISVTKYRMIAFVVSAALAGAAGALFGGNFSQLSATKFDFNTSILILVFVVLGGLGNMRGSVIAVALLTVLPELLRQFSDYRMLIYAIVLILVMIFTNNPQLKAFFAHIKDRFAPKKEVAADAQ